MRGSNSNSDESSSNCRGVYYKKILKLIILNGIKITPNDICRSKMNIIVILVIVVVNGVIVVNLKINVKKADKIYIYT